MKNSTGLSGPLFEAGFRRGRTDAHGLKLLKTAAYSGCSGLIRADIGNVRQAGAE
ncbi:MAG: hypothetical protein V1792_24330 [Pseudomonadota bacterium]